MQTINVVVDVPLARTFDYLSPDLVAIGTRVLVPFGRRTMVGIVVGAGGQAPTETPLRPIERVLEDTPALPAEWMRLTEFASRYYQRPLGEVMLSALPPRLKRLPPLRASALRSSGQAPAGEWRFIDEHPLTPPQASALEAITQGLGRSGTFLLHGITGSGKTEVYLHAVAATLRRERQALVLVPEIHLTPQLEAHFRTRFPGAHIEVMHSNRSAVERALAWRAAQIGGAQIILGTRLAVFAPFAALGLIVIDEEHDPSFKQQDGVRYSARDLAVWRGYAARIPVVLGSATPSLESHANASIGRYQRLTLPGRARPGSRLPSLALIDTGREVLQDGLTASLTAAIEATLVRGEQTLIFLNRRGYAPVLACNACGWIPSCPRCSTHVAVHLGERRLRCHHCGFEARIPPRCPDCGNADLQPFGRGTERLEESLATRFPQARLTRVDSDTMRLKGTWEATQGAIHAGEVDIILGTQMLAKGHDFPRLTLVGILNADSALFAADYRAPERLFAQLQQVAGRAGRDALPGRVLIQTRFPDHPLYRALLAGDYNRFAEDELLEREHAGFPPSVAEAVLRAEARSPEAAIAFLTDARERAPADADVVMYDPVPMSLERLNGWYRAHLLVQATQRPALQRYLALWRAAIEIDRAPRHVRWHIDVDPIEF
jgi:primosomal protein N' (replication factor Y)